MCSNQNLQLIRHDYNEPQCDKGQADGAVAKRFISAYVHAGNDCLSVEDMKNAILFSGGPKNMMVQYESAVSLKVLFLISNLIILFCSIAQV